MKKMFMAVIALMMTISASAQFYIYCSDGNVIKVDSISMMAPSYDETLGIGTFSVGANKQVSFSKGNLQYTQSTNTWSFAEHQWDYIGTDNVTGGDVTSDPTYGEEKEGTALADKIDFFAWSTSTTNFGVSISEDWDDYSGSFVDWGTNKIGNDEPNTWRTLSYNEWEYLLNNRPNASSLKGVAQVNGVNGLILLPDNWTCPAGVTFKSGFHSDYDVDYAAYQTFTTAEWSKLEAAGAVFLPAACYRNVSVVFYYVQTYGMYWSATEGDSFHAGFLYFGSDEAGMYDDRRYFGLSVRLVKDIVEGTMKPDTPTEPEKPDTPTEPEEPTNPEEPTDPEEPTSKTIITITPDTLLLNIGESYRLTASVVPEGTASEITWISDNQDAVAVNSAGIVEALGFGTANIIASADGAIADTCVVIVDATNTFEIGGYSLFELGSPIAGTDTVLEISIGAVKCQLAMGFYYIWDDGIVLAGNSLTGSGFLMSVEAPTYIIMEGAYAGYYISAGEFMVDTVPEDVYTPYTGQAGQLHDVQMYGDAWKAILNLPAEPTYEEIDAAYELYYGSQTGTPFFHIDSTGVQSYYYGNVSYLYLTEDRETAELYYALKLEWYDNMNPNRCYGLATKEVDGATVLVEPYDMHVINKEYSNIPTEEKSLAVSAKKTAKNNSVSGKISKLHPMKKIDFPMPMRKVIR